MCSHQRHIMIQQRPNIQNWHYRMIVYHCWLIYRVIVTRGDTRPRTCFPNQFCNEKNPIGIILHCACHVCICSILAFHTPARLVYRKNAWHDVSINFTRLVNVSNRIYTNTPASHCFVYVPSLSWWCLRKSMSHCSRDTAYTTQNNISYLNICSDKWDIPFSRSYTVRAMKTVPIWKGLIYNKADIERNCILLADAFGGWTSILNAWCRHRARIDENLVGRKCFVFQAVILCKTSSSAWFCTSVTVCNTNAAVVVSVTRNSLRCSSR